MPRKMLHGKLGSHVKNREVQMQHVARGALRTRGTWHVETEFSTCTVLFQLHCFHDMCEKNVYLETCILGLPVKLQNIK